MDSKKVLMNVSRIAFVITIGLVALLFVLYEPPVVDNRIVLSFTDDLVCTKVAIDLGGECVDKTVKLDQEVIDSYTEFVLKGNVNSLNGLENFKNLNSVRILNATNLVDLNPLRSLDLTSLTISSDNGSILMLNDISPIVAMSNLKYLDIAYTSVLDVSMLNTLNNLESLVIDNTGIIDINMLNNGSLKVEKSGLVFNTTVRQNLDDVILNSVDNFKDLVIEGPCRIDSKNMLAYTNGEGDSCVVKTPDDFIKLSYNLVSE